MKVMLYRHTNVESGNPTASCVNKKILCDVFTFTRYFICKTDCSTNIGK